MPVAFCSILGGMITMIGTPPNIIIAIIRQEQQKSIIERAKTDPSLNTYIDKYFSAEDFVPSSFGLFDFTPVGGIIALIGVLFVALIGWRLIPKSIQKSPKTQSLFSMDEYVTEIENEYKNYSVLSSKFGKIKDDNKSIISLINKSSNYKDYISQQNSIQKSINQIDAFISGNKSKKDVREKDVETISNRLSVATRGINSSYGPTGMQIASLTKAKSLIIKLAEMIDNLKLEFTKLKNQVESELDAYILD